MKKYFLAAIIGTFALVGIAFLAVHQTLPPPPPRVPANIFITEPGHYLSPNGSRIVKVWLEKTGQLKFQVTDEKGNGGGPAQSFDAKSDWLMCWDSKERLWTYVPEQDRCCRYWYSNENEFGSCLSGEAGGWEGIPEPFLKRLPENVTAIYENFRAEQLREGVTQRAFGEINLICLVLEGYSSLPKS